MATESSPPQIRIILTVAFSSVVILGALNSVFRSYFLMMTEEVEHDHLSKPVELLTLQNSSMHAASQGRPREALQIASSVLEGPYRLSPRLKALFLSRKARAMAQGGDGAALGLLPEIRSLFLDGVSDADPAWAWWVDEREKPRSGPGVVCGSPMAAASVSPAARGRTGASTGSMTWAWVASAIWRSPMHMARNRCCIARP